MARRKAKAEEPELDDDEDLDDEDGEEEDDDEEDDAGQARDYTMARLAAARVSAQAALDAIDESLMLFVCPDQDKSGSKREEMMEAASDALGEASRGIEAAQGGDGWGAMTVEDVKLGEPDDDEED